MTARLLPLPETFRSTRTALHRVAEQIVAPARKPDNEIALETTLGGFGTPVFGHAQQVRVDRTELVYRVGDDERRTPLSSLEAAAQLVAELVPEGPLSDAPLDVDPDAAARLADWYAFGTEVLNALADDTATPVHLWPEHFDIALDLGDERGRATYGFSPGDDDHDHPYAYVAPWTAEVSGELWQATGFRGAELSYADLLAAGDQRAAALEFFTTRKDALA